MAARPLLIVVKSVTTAPRPLQAVFRASARLLPVSATTAAWPATRSRTLHATSYAAANAASLSTGAVQNPSSTPPSPGQAPPSVVVVEFDTKHAAFLGEADSNDAFEAAHEINPPVLVALDATHAAFLGEADSDDGFVTHREAHGSVEALDPSESAYLGEADRDDGFEIRQILNPTDHGPLDPTLSAFHGQPGEHDAHEEDHKRT